MKKQKINLAELEMWLHPKQKAVWVAGNEIYQYLKDNNLLEDCLTLEDLKEIKKLGLDEFNKYFKGKWVYAWKSVQDGDVPYLVECGDEVVLRGYWLGYGWNASGPALRRRSSGLGDSELSETLPLDLPHFLSELKELIKKYE